MTGSKLCSLVKLADAQACMATPQGNPSGCLSPASPLVGNSCESSLTLSTATPHRGGRLSQALDVVGRRRSPPPLNPNPVGRFRRARRKAALSVMVLGLARRRAIADWIWNMGGFLRRREWSPLHVRLMHDRWDGVVFAYARRRGRDPGACSPLYIRKGEPFILLAVRMYMWEPHWMVPWSEALGYNPAFPHGCSRPIDAAPGDLRYAVQASPPLLALLLVEGVVSAWCRLEAVHGGCRGLG